MGRKYDISVVVSTYNRCDMLPGTLESLLAQEAPNLHYEVIVVDNNSTDCTRHTVESFIRRGQAEVLYVFEGRQGLSHGRNAGIAQARAPIIAFTDDDVRPMPTWMVSIQRAFDKHPQVECVSGKILPRWMAEPPSWLTREDWTVLALQEYGDEPFYVGSDKPISLAGANLSFRATTFERIGLFLPDFPRAQDHEFLMRLLRASGLALYVPDAVVIADVQAERLTKKYHRKWHDTNGKFNALMYSAELTGYDGRILKEMHDTVTLFDAPAYLYRGLMVEAWRWMKAVVRRDESASFSHENRMRFLFSYINNCRKRNGGMRSYSAFIEVTSFIRMMLRKKIFNRMPDSKRLHPKPIPPGLTKEENIHQAERVINQTKELCQ